MTHNIAATLSQIRNTCPRFENVTFPFSDPADEDALMTLGHRLHQQGGADLVGRVLLDLVRDPAMSEDFTSWLAMVWPAD